MRNPHVQRILRGLAGGDLDLAHETFDPDPSPRTAMHIRELLMGCGALPYQDRRILTFQLWLDRVLPDYEPESRRLLTGFATWHHLRRMREDAHAGRLKPGSVRAARQQITVAGQLLVLIADQHIGLAGVRQQHLDAWLAAGPSTSYVAQNFVVWAVKHHQLPPLTFPPARPGTPVITQAERLILLARFLQPAPDDGLQPGYRLAAVLLLLYAQPMSRIARLRLDDITETPDGPTIRLGAQPCLVPAPVAALLHQHLGARRNVNTAANANSPWLFPATRRASHSPRRTS